MGSSFHREGAVYLKERFVIFKEEWVGGRARVTIDEERVLCRIRILDNSCTCTVLNFRFKIKVFTRNSSGDHEMR